MLEERVPEPYPGEVNETKLYVKAAEFMLSEVLGWLDNDGELASAT